MIKRKAIESEDGSFTFTVDNPDELLHKFTLGIGDKYFSENCEVFYDPNNYTGCPTVEVWISTRQNLEDIPEFTSGEYPIIDCIKKYDTISDDDREKWASKIETDPYVQKIFNKYYNYHLEFIPAGHVADFFPSLYPHKLSDDKSDDRVVGIGNDGSTVTFEKGSLAEFAISHGCDYMDMSTMTTYRGI